MKGLDKGKINILSTKFKKGIDKLIGNTYIMGNKNENDKNNQTIQQIKKLQKTFKKGIDKPSDVAYNTVVSCERT